MSQTGLSGTSAAAACWALCRPLRTHDTTWVPAPNNPKVTLNVVLDGCIVPTESGAARVDYSHLVLLDNFIDERTRQQLLDCLTGRTRRTGRTAGLLPSALYQQPKRMLFFCCRQCRCHSYSASLLCLLPAFQVSQQGSELFVTVS